MDFAKLLAKKKEESKKRKSLASSSSSGGAGGDSKRQNAGSREGEVFKAVEDAGSSTLVISASTPTDVSAEQQLVNAPTIGMGGADKELPSVSVKFESMVIRKLIQLREGGLAARKVLFKQLSQNELRFAHGAAWQIGLEANLSRSLVEVNPRARQENNEVLVQFVHTPKCGGMSFKAHLKQLDGRKAQQWPRDFRVKSSHGCTIVLINGHLPARNFSPNALIVGLARDPQSRFESSFSYIKEGSVDNVDQEAWWRNRLQKYKSISEFVGDEKVMNTIMSEKEGKNHFFPLSYWLCGDEGKPIVDIVLRQDHWDHDMALFCDMLGIPPLPAETKRVNVTTKKYKMNGDADWSKLSKWWPQDRQLFDSLNENHSAMADKAREKLAAQIKASKMKSAGRTDTASARSAGSARSRGSGSGSAGSRGSGSGSGFRVKSFEEIMEEKRQQKEACQKDAARQ
jgi:hypothetical protein